ncbi:TRAP transporter fused permease subunit [Wenzhouxiangella sp. AB-CW3]|uniref:TRAP transporter permease n=1 Tax=Wenzhouxiangella sp. AB-CW3 TaxID=2771012 RepID=UPI00168B10F8|nr:TRAP transporter fused permease subunit [Wenzhouxiangella sp. AB-CW3]QOC21357.1 TRAP transporter fused permease subunit [Wenzhouxiangella sp. AB-CW3]
MSGSSSWRERILASARSSQGTGARDLPPWGQVVLFVGAAVIAVLHVALNTWLIWPDLWVATFHFGSLGLLALVLFPSRGVAVAGRADIGGWLDIAAGVLLILACAAVLLLEEYLYERGLHFSTTDWVASVAIVTLSIELARRTAGVLIPALVVLGLSYAVWWGQHIGGIFAFPGLSLETMLFRSVYTSEGMFGTIARISWSYVFMFILLGAFLVRSGAGDFILALARATAGRITGGPGLVAVASSGLMGSITGSAVANTASTGVITIPLMKRAGFPPRFAGGIEAAASTGGQLMPPVMGAGAFLMANFTGIDYLAIIAVALIPALMYFLSLAFFVRIRARRLGLAPRDDADGIPLSEALARGWPLLLPLLVLIGLLIAGFTPVFAACISIVAVVAASWLTPVRMGPLAVVEAMAAGVRTMVPTAMLLIAVGLIINVLTTTGIGNTFSIMIGEWAGMSLLLALVLVALASLVLGMGLPVTAAYIVLAAISAPTIYGLMLQADLVNALVAGEISDRAREAILLARPGIESLLGSPMPVAEAQATVAAMTPELQRTAAEAMLDPAVLAGSLLAAHLIIFWFSQDSNVTPPVALAAFTAAGIAGERPMPTGLTAWKLAKALYLIPVLFAYTPLVSGTWSEALQVAVVAVTGLYALAGVFEGWLEGPLKPAQRVLLAMLALVLLFPHDWWWADVMGMLLVAILLWRSRRLSPRTV